ncbi:alanine racemase [Aeromicrobium sp. YIM 150415]|uniref:alanine racemase n=1 Tax=Aeromicrobium sp. YIM 150415 TaxID=2803912 RepID=UPI0019658633|nr:alanine racemase [Aeromicrobium sp. YIM 150415]MBM9462035.1 alanine racemase [Aeromicrobium sp. YIM 150415]
MSGANGAPAAAELVVDLDAYRENLRVLRELAPASQQMAVVKANGYGHGMVPIARAARDAGADWLGVARPEEALALRSAGDDGPVLCWLETPGAPFAELVEAGIEVTASSAEQLEEILAAAPSRPRVQLKVDTGLSRNGARFGADWSALVRAASRAQDGGRVQVTGVWSHFACADEPDNPASAEQEAVFIGAVDELRGAGVEPGLRHLSNSAGILTRPSAHFDLVRVGIASYGIDPDPAVRFPGVRPVLTARARLAQVKEVEAGARVSYGYRWTADHPTRLGLVPVGYGDGLHRTASNRAEMGYAGRRVPVRGTICMDQCVIDLGELPARRGDLVTLFGPGDDGEPTAEEWAQAAGTIGYEIVTRLAGRWTRTYRGER